MVAPSDLRHRRLITVDRGVVPRASVEADMEFVMRFSHFRAVAVLLYFSGASVAQTISGVELTKKVKDIEYEEFYRTRNYVVNITRIMRGRLGITF
jgi:hypothetical protein